MLSTRAKVALAAAVQRPIVSTRRLFGLGPVLTTRRGGIRWELDLREGIDFAIWLIGAFERRTMAAYSRLVRENAVIVDIGANIGAHTLPLAARLGPDGHVLAVEPSHWAIGKLRANLALNPDLSTRVSLHQLLLAEDTSAKVPEAIYASWPLAGGRELHPQLRARGTPTSGASATTLDALAEAERLDRLDLIKLDVDGNECRVLGGARDVLRRFRPDIVCELSPWVLAERGDSAHALLDLLETHGYRLLDLNQRLLPRDRAKLLRQVPEAGGINIIARASV